MDLVTECRRSWRSEPEVVVSRRFLRGLGRNRRLLVSVTGLRNPGPDLWGNGERRSELYVQTNNARRGWNLRRLLRQTRIDLGPLLVARNTARGAVIHMVAESR